MTDFKLTDAERKALAKDVVAELMEQFQIGLGKSILDHIWKVVIGIIIAAAIYGLASSQILHQAVNPPPHS